MTVLQVSRHRAESAIIGRMSSLTNKQLETILGIILAGTDYETSIVDSVNPTHEALFVNVVRR